MRRRGASATACVVLACLAACAPGARAPQPNVVLIVASALRADHVGCYGGGVATPAIDGLARDGVRFANAYATAPWVVPSVASLLTGRLPSSHGAAQFDRALAAEQVTLAELLRDHGYATHAIVSDFLLGPARGLDQGFTACEQVLVPGASSSEQVAAGARSFLRGARSAQPFFLFVHLGDAAPPLVRHDADGGVPGAVGELDGGESLDYLQVTSSSLSAAEREFLRELYAGEVRAVDRAVARVLATLDELGLARNTLVIVAGSHGYEWMDRGGIGDGHGLHEELVRAPCVARLPGSLPRARVVADPVSLAALAPTVLALLGIGSESMACDASSLLPRLRGEAAHTAEAVRFEVDFEPSVAGQRTRVAHQRGVRVGGLKLIHDSRAAEDHLFDLAQDPLELHDLAAERADLVRELSSSLRPQSRAAPPP